MPDEIPRFDDWVKTRQPSPRGLDPAFQTHVDDILKSLQRRGLNARLSEGYRSPEQQDEYYAQGRTKPGRIVTNATGRTGKHPRGIAADIDLLDASGRLLSDNDPAWSAIGEEAAGRGLTWGGNWKLRDMRHVELNQNPRRQSVPKFDEWKPESGIPTFDDWSRDSGQIPPPSTAKSGTQSRRIPATPARAPSAPILKTRPQWGRATSEQQEQIRAGISAFERLRGQPQQGPEVVDAGNAIDIDLQSMSPQPTPSMQARMPSVWERLKEAVSPYVPGLTSIDTPGGIKTDPIRGALSGVTLGALGEPRQVSREETLLDPQAQERADLAYKVGQFAPAVVPYIAAGKVLSAVPLLNRATRTAQIARTALTFGGVELGREAVSAVKHNKPLDAKEIAISTAIGGAIGGLTGLNPSIKREIIAAITPQAVADTARGVDPETALFNAMTNALFGLHSAASRRGAKAEQTKSDQPALSPEALEGIQRAREDMRRAIDERNLRRGTQTEVQPSVEAQRETVEPTPETAAPLVRDNLAQRAGVRSARPENVSETGLQSEPRTSDAGLRQDLPKSAPSAEASQRYYHRDWGEVEVLPDQSGARPGRVKVAEVADPTKQHFPKRSDLSGRGNQRMVPVKPEDTRALREAEEVLDTETRQRAYHGSPHEFGKFTLQKIGEGEGDQAYGWGLYFTGNRGVAEYYREVLSEGSVQFTENNQPAKIGKNEGFGATSLEFVLYEHQGIKNRSDAIAFLTQELGKPDAPEHLGEYKAALKLLTDHPGLEVRRKPKGKVYTVELAPKSDEWLDWDKSLGEQSPRVQKLLKQAGVYDLQQQANEFYANLQARAPGSITPTGRIYPEANPRKASKYLRSIGIRGIRYFTGETRNKEAEKEYNYVLFDDKDVRMAPSDVSSEPANKISAETTTRPEDSVSSTVTRASATERTAAGFKEDLSLSQFVRKMGGIVPTEDVRGELDRLRLRETGTSGLINQKARQGDVKQSADIMMQAANDAGYRDPKTGQPFEKPSDFLYAVERDVLGEKIRVSSGTEDFSAAEAEYYAEQESRIRAAEARNTFLESGRGAELFDRIVDRKASDAEREEYIQLAEQAGISRAESADLIADARAETESLQGDRREGAQPPSRPAEQLGFVQEGLTQQEASPPQSTSQREALIRSEQQRQAQLNPERTAALAKLDEIQRRGMTVDDYARQPDLTGNVPSAEEVRLLKEAETGRRAEPSEESGQLNFGPGTMRAGEPLPEVKERKFGKRFTEDERIADEIRSEIGTAKYYEPIPNKVTVEQSRDLVNRRGVAGSIRILKDETNDLQPHVRSTMGQIVIRRLNEAYRNLKESKPEEARRVLNAAVDLAEWQMEYGTRLGQGVQSFAMWARLTPEGMLLTYKRAVNKARARQAKLFGEDIAEIVKTINGKMSDAEREEALRKLFKTNKTARKVKSDFEKLLEAAKTGELTDTLFYEIVGDKLGLPKYNRETAEKITELAHRIEEAPEGLPRNKLILELQKFIAEQKGFDVADLPLGVFYGNILSGYNTHAVNFADTGLNVLSEINGLALNNPRAAARVYAGMLRGFGEGRFDAIMEMTQGRMVTDGKWLEVPRLMEIARFGEKGGVPIKTETKVGRLAKKVAESKIAIPLNAYKYVTRAMAASDALMFRAAKEARATLLAYRIAQAEGLKGGALETRVREILALDREGDFVAQARREDFTGNEAQYRAKELREMVRDKDLSSDAAEFAGEATYNHKPHGTIGLIAERIGKLSEDVKPLKLFVPFTRIVANVTNRGLNYTPYGYKRAFAGWGFGKNAEPLTAEGRRLMLTRATMGTAGMALLGGLQAAGLVKIHGNGPSDREKRRQLQNAGWRPYSLQIGDAYVVYANSPVGLGLSIIGNMSDAERYHELEQKDAATRGAYAVARLGSTIFSQSFLSGLSRLFGALSEEPGKSVTSVKQFLGGTVSSFAVPNIARDVHRLFDNKAYQSNTLMEDLIRSTPFAALALNPQLNAFGEPVKLQRQRFLDVQTSDPAWRFVVRKGLRVPVPGRTTEIEKDKRITPEQYYQLLKKTGPQIKQWITDNQARLEPMREQDAQDELQSAATAIRKRALDEMRGKMVKPMKPPAPPKPEAPARP